MPSVISAELSGHDVSHVDDLDLKSLRNGALLAYARTHFDCLITLDRGILFQHNHVNQSLRIVVLRVPNSRKETILLRANDVRTCLADLAAGELREI